MTSRKSDQTMKPETAPRASPAIQSEVRAEAARVKARNAERAVRGN
ncbi:MAG: hypothetical protein ACYCZY_00705 [Lacisediminihabitans sp.]